MEFHEKLQQLRKQKNLTQEQLAERLFVSRTAVSKWESGRGFPNLESLKCISKLFSVSIDELLSNNELLELAQTENKTNIKKISALVFGVLDIISIVFLFMPLSGQQDGEYIRSVALIVNTAITNPLRIICLLTFAIICFLGILEIIIYLIGSMHSMQICSLCSVVIHSAAILLFAMSRQPYITAFLFLLFMIKVVLIVHEKKIT